MSKECNNNYYYKKNNIIPCFILIENRSLVGPTTKIVSAVVDGPFSSMFIEYIVLMCTDIDILIRCCL